MILRNLNIVKDIVEFFRLQSESVDEDIEIVGNVEILKPSRRLGIAQSSATGTMAITFSTTKNTKITGVYYAYSKDATCDTTSIPSVFKSAEDGDISLWFGTVISAEKQNENVYMDFAKHPLKALKGGTLTLGGTFGAGKLSRVLVVFGYEED